MKGKRINRFTAYDVVDYHESLPPFSLIVTVAFNETADTELHTFRPHDITVQFATYNDREVNEITWFTDVSNTRVGVPV